MNKSIIASIVAMALIAGVAVIPLSMSTANAGDVCKFNAQNQRCDLDIDKVTGGFKLSIVNEQNNNQTGGGGGSTVDQGARDNITALQGDVGQLQSEDQSQNARVDSLVSENTALNQTVGSLTEQLNSVSSELSQVRADLANLTSQVITGISLSNGTVGGGTGGNTTGNTTNPGGNGTGTVGNGTGGNVTGNGSGNGTEGNGTIPTGLNLQQAFNNFLARS